jgi:phage repressor protein C with HTH and peptisase S24 domain
VVTQFSNNNQVPLDYINIPNLPKCDGAVYVVGDSMYPLLKSGDIIMFKKIEDVMNGIFWGEMYLINYDQDGDDLVMVKYIQKSAKGDDYVRLVSQNTNHQDKDIPIIKIRGLGLVKASIRINSMS